MKSNENFDYNFFIKIICVIAALALVFVIAVTLVSLITRDAPVKTNGDNAETFVFADSESNPAQPPDTEAESDTYTEPPVTEKVPETEAETVADTESETETSSDEPFASPTVLGKTDDAGDDYIEKLTFLGDSTTYGLKAYKMLAGGKNTKQVWTSSSASLSLNKILEKKIVYPDTGKEMTIAEAAEKAKPEYLVITLGVEGVTFLDEEGFKEQYTALVEAVKNASPDTKIILQSIFPVNSETFSNPDKLNNDLIDKANGWVLEIAENTGVHYLDTQSVLKSADGGLDKKYDNGGNGINLNDTGFGVVLDYIKRHALV